MTTVEIVRERERSREIEAKREYPDNDECRNAYIKGAEWADDFIFLDFKWQGPDEEPVAKNFQIIYYSEYFRTFEMDYGYNLVIAHGGEEMSWKNVVKKKKLAYGRMRIGCCLWSRALGMVNKKLKMQNESASYCQKEGRNEI